MIQQKIKEYFNVCGDKSTYKTGLLLTFVICFVSYSAFIVYGFASPDGILEGFHYYTNQHWAIGGCGRWFLAFLNIIHANLVFPWLTILECFIVNWLSAHTLCKIFKIEKKPYYYLTCSLFAVLPTFVEMYTYTNSAFSFCVSILFSILFVYFNLFNNNYLALISAILLGCAMGSYQSQIGIAVGLTVMCLIYKVLDKENNKLKFCIKSLISGILGLVVYIAGLYLFLNIYNLELYSRASTFSLSNVFTNFIPQFLNSYKVFFSIFNQITLKRWFVYIVIFVILLIEILIIIIKLIKEKEYINAVLFLLLVLLLPPALNIIGIILPSQPITNMMVTPDYIIIPFILGLSSYIVNKIEVILRVVLSVCVVFLTWTYVLSANATYDSYRLSYNMFKTQFSSAMDEVLELDGYKMNETRIIVIGRPSESKLRENIHIYNYGINLYNNLLYWESPELDPRATSIYIMNEFGIDPGVMEYDEYSGFVELPECLEMPSWPREGSVKMINGCAVIKFSEVYE